MKRPFIFILGILAISLMSYPGSADFNNRLGLYGLDRNAEYTDLLQVKDYSFRMENSGIVQVWHTIPYGTVINEFYSWDGEQINVRFYCMNNFFTTTCSFHTNDGSQTSDTNESWISLGLLNPMIDTSVVNDNNGTIYFGVGQHLQFDNFFGIGNPALISFPNNSYKPILSMTGTSSELIDMTFLTLDTSTYAEYINSPNLNSSYGDMQRADTVKTAQSFVMDLVSIIDNLIAYPYLIFAYLEIFALMFSLKSRDMAQWWKKYIKIHSDMIGFVLNNASLVITSLIVVVTISTLASIFGLSG